MKNIIKIVTIAVIIQLSATSLFSQSKIGEAYKAYCNCSYTNANTLYLEVWNDTNSSSEDKAAAGKRLAYLSWHIKQDIDKAREYINSSIELKTNEVDLLLELSKYELGAQNFKQALQLCKKAIKFVKNSSQEIEIRVQGTKITLTEAVFQIKKNENLNLNTLKNALKKITEINKKESGRLDANEIQLGLALILNDGKLSYEAWKGYFRIASNERAKGILSEADKDLESVLTNWKENQLTFGQRNKLILGLANSRFYHYADIVNVILPSVENENPNEIKDILNYYAFANQ
jgi:hypothetical protein